MNKMRFFAFILLFASLITMMGCFGNTEIIPVHKHVLERRFIENMTDITKSYWETYCNYCSFRLRDTRPVLDHNHNFFEGEYVQGANCQSYGYKQLFCQDCAYYTRQYDEEKRAHKFKEVWETDVPSTTTVHGSESRHCIWYNECGEKIDDRELPLKKGDDLSSAPLPDSGKLDIKPGDVTHVPVT